MSPNDSLRQVPTCRCLFIFDPLFCLDPTGFAACHKCDAIGHRIKAHKMTSYRRLVNAQGEPAKERTDEDFRARSDPEHHHHRTKIELERLNVDIVKLFTIDAMHCFCRGAMVRLFQFLIANHNSVTLPLITPTQFINWMGKTWKQLTFCIEFNRRPNSFKHWDSFKCTELRMFGLYGMEIILRHFCHVPGIQQAFYALAMAMRICSDVKLFRKHWRVAKSLFDLFITNTAAQWGDNFVSLAIHQLQKNAFATTKLAIACLVTSLRMSSARLRSVFEARNIH
jgi:hypothetical protein